VAGQRADQRAQHHDHDATAQTTKTTTIALFIQGSPPLSSASWSGHPRGGRGRTALVLQDESR